MNMNRTQKDEFKNPSPLVQSGFLGILAAMVFGLLMLSLLGLPFWLPMLIESILTH